MIQSVRIKNRKEILSILEDIHLADCGKEKWSFLEVKQTVNKIAWIFMEDEDGYEKPAEKIEMEYLFEYLNMVLENYNIHIVFQVLGRDGRQINWSKVRIYRTRANLYKI